MLGGPQPGLGAVVNPCARLAPSHAVARFEPHPSRIMIVKDAKFIQMITKPLTEPNQNKEIEFGAAPRNYRSRQLKHTSETSLATCRCQTRRNGGARASNCSSKLVELSLSFFFFSYFFFFCILGKADCEPTGAPPGWLCSAGSCAPPTKLGWWKRSFPLL